jgi:hypothetical protein
MLDAANESYLYSNLLYGIKGDLYANKYTLRNHEYREYADEPKHWGVVCGGHLTGRETRERLARLS